jgi:hypothetical protein
MAEKTRSCSVSKETSPLPIIVHPNDLYCTVHWSRLCGCDLSCGILGREIVENPAWRCQFIEDMKCEPELVGDWAWGSYYNDIR